MKHSTTIFVCLIIAGLLVWAAAARAEEPSLLFPKTAEEIEHYFLQRKPRTFQTKGPGAPQGKGLVNKVVEDDAELADLPKVGASIHFDFDSAAIRAESYPLLAEFATALQRGLQEAVIVIFGHTDSVGPEAYNLKLSEKRAQAMKDFLAKRHGIDTQRLIVKFYGETKPLKSNDTKAHRALNRRVEFACIW